MEATILFPIIIMVFAGLVLLSMYLPTRAVLQEATQYAATAIATERSDTWLRQDPDSLTYYWEDDRSQLGNVYSSLWGGLTGNNREDPLNAEQIVINMEKKSIIKPAGELTVEYDVVNCVVYKEIVVTATRTIPMPVDLSFVGVPKEIPITVTSVAVVQNGDEFIRNMDLAKDMVLFLSEKFKLTELFNGVKQLGEKFTGFLGI